MRVKSYVTLGDVCEKGSSNIAQKDLEQIEGEYPVFGASGLIKHINFYIQEKEYIAIVKDGAGIGRTMLLPAFSSVIGTMQYIIPNEKVDIRYLYYVLNWMNLAKYYSGATIPHIYFKDYKKERFPLQPMEEQRKIATVLDKVCELIALRRKQLERLDLMVKARFVEMFGDPLDDTTKHLSVPMTNLCDIIDGDRGKNYPKPDEFEKDGFCLFLNAKNVTAKGFCFDSCLFVTEQKDKTLRKGKLIRGDIVLTTRGTIGNLALYDRSVPFEQMRINSGMVILRLKKSMILEIFFIEQFRMLLNSIKERIASGTAQPQLPISAMDKIYMIVPDAIEQRMFSTFVTEIDKLKLPIQHSLDTLEVLKKSLMQEYFGQGE